MQRDTNDRCGTLALGRTSLLALAAFLVASSAQAAPLGGLARPAVDTNIVRIQSEAATIGVRAGSHEGYTRLVFDWTQNVDYKAAKDGAQVVVDFARGATFDFAAVKRKLPSGVAAIDQTLDGGRTRVNVQLTGDARLRHFRSGTKVVIDFLVGPETAAATPTDAKPAAKETAAKTAPESPKTPAESAKPPAEAAKPAAEPAKAATKPAGEKAPSAAVEAAAKVLAAAKAPPSPAPQAPPASAAPTSIVPPALDKPGAEKTAAKLAPAAAPPSAAPDAAKKGPTAVTFAGTPERPRIVFSFKAPGAISVFQRAGFLWVVTDEALTVQIAPVPEHLASAIPLAERIAVERATAFRFRVRDGLFATIAPGGDGWGLDLGTRPVPARGSALVSREPDSPLGARVLIAVDEPGSRIVVKDPEVGDSLFVVPVRVPVGVVVEREFLQFRLLASIQGVVVSPTADDVAVKLVRNGVEVTGKGGLIISNQAALTKPPADGQGEPAKDGAAPASEAAPVEAKPAPIPVPAGPIFNYDRFQVAGAKNDIEAERSLFSALIETPPPLRTEKRWAIAKFYFGNGRYPDALGAMQVIAENDPLLLENAEFRALRGATLAQLGRYEDALIDLTFAPLDGDAGARLWRGLAKAGLKDWRGASDDLTSALDALDLFPPREKAAFQIATARAAFEKQDFARIPASLNPVLKEPPSVRAQAHAELLMAKAKAELGDVDGAIEGFDKVIALDDRLTRTEARYAKANLELKEGKIDTATAIGTLDKMRHAWRGDELEYRILHRAATMHLEAKQYRDGLTGLREIALYFPETPQAKDVAKEMEEVFRKLFLEGAADNLAPYSAIALYYDFRELTPAGTDGDVMIRKLADRLAAVELFDRAAQLLDHQVRFRLNGEDKSRIGAKLAVVYLLDRKPQDAIRIIRISRPTSYKIPPELQTERDLLEARALLDLDRTEEALKLIEKDVSRNAEILRTEVAWRAGNWNRVVQGIEQVLAERWKDTTPLDAIEEVQVLRLSVALTLLDNRIGLDSVRRRYAEKMAAGARAKSFDLLTTDFERTKTPFRELAKEVAALGMVDAFMANYKDLAKKNAAFAATSDAPKVN